MSKGPSWTTDEETVLRVLFKNGAQDEVIAAALNKSDAAIRGARARLGLARRVYKIESKIAPPKHSDNLPDVAELLVKNNQILTRIEVVLTSMMHKQQDVCRAQEATYAFS